MAKTNNEGKKFIEKGSFVKKGTTIIEAEPFVFVLNSKLRNERCDNCLKSCKIFRCAGCRYVHYCSRNCQKKSWFFHKIECPNIKRVHPLEIPNAARLMAHIIIKLNNGGSEERGYYSSTEYRTFEDLMSHYGNVREDLKRMEHFRSLCIVLIEYLPNLLMPSVKQLLEIYGRICINSFHILNNDLTSIGVGLYLAPSIIDHSCRANTSTVFNGTTIIVRTVRDIPSFDWTKVSVPYIDVLRTVDERRKELQTVYYFHCNCDRCINPELVATAAACPNKNCTNPCFPKDLKCTKCNEIFPSNFRENFELIEARSLHNLDILEKIEIDEQLEICRKCLKQQERLLHPLNMLHVRMVEIASRVANELEIWQEAEIYARKHIEQYEYYYGDSHPLTGTAYLTLAKVLGFAEKAEQAYDVIKKTSEIVKTAFGEKHPKMQEIDHTTLWIYLECKKS